MPFVLFLNIEAGSQKSQAGLQLAAAKDDLEHLTFLPPLLSTGMHQRAH